MSERRADLCQISVRFIKYNFFISAGLDGHCLHQRGSPVELDFCPTFDVVVHLHTAFAIKPPCPANCPQSVLAVLLGRQQRVFEVTYFCAGPCHRRHGRRRRPGNPATARLQLGTAAGALYLPPPSSKWPAPACIMTICLKSNVAGRRFGQENLTIL